MQALGPRLCGSRYNEALRISGGLRVRTGRQFLEEFLGTLHIFLDACCNPYFLLGEASSTSSCSPPYEGIGPHSSYS